MPNRSPKTIRCDDELWTRFEEYVYEKEGDSQGAKPKHLETALREYLDEGRSARIESKLDEVLDHVRDEPTTHTHTTTPNTQQGSETVEKVRLIADRVYTHHANSEKEVIPPNVVERAIEDIAGIDDRTVDRYEKQLKRRNLLFQHPGGAVWTDDKETWAVWTSKYEEGTPSAQIKDILDAYDMELEEFEELEARCVSQ